MKLKQQPEDFQVEELSDVMPGATGDFAFYRLTKSGWTTLDAMAAIRRRWRLDANRFAWGGLKDRHALTRQFFSILHGPRRKLTHQQIRVEYLGQIADAYGSGEIRANRFDITLRGLAEVELPGILKHAEALATEGVPNYFDDQRFGSTIPGGEFVAKLLVEGSFESALQLALTGKYEHDRGRARREKDIIRRNWGQWQECQTAAARSPMRRVFEYLRQRPVDFRGGFVRMPPELRTLYLAAYQSHLWNRILARWLTEQCRPDQLLRLRTRHAALPVHRGLTDAQLNYLANLSLPLPTARWHADEDPRRPLVESVLAEDGLNLDHLQFKGIRAMFFSKGERAALCRPGQWSHETACDDRNSGARKLRLRFTLSRGSYATMIVKRLTAMENDP